MASTDKDTSSSQSIEQSLNSNRRIVKNALMLYIRMFLTMIVGLYTSRVVLDVLGVEDYGTYGIVGGVVGMLGFINMSMSGATSRFMTFELGRGDLRRMELTFSSALMIHIGIALIVFIFAETVGLWFLMNKLVIPEGRMTAAHWVYQMSIASAMLGITQAPYNATIMAHEKMDVYAYVEILNVTLKLLIVYLLTIGKFDKLILYAALVLAVSVFIRMVYRLYCVQHFPESRFHWVWEPSIMKPMLSYSGWNLYGNMGVIFQKQGTNFVINFFFGVVLNAAVSVGLTVANTVNQFAANVMAAFRPQIIKHYSQNKKDEMRDLTIMAIKIIMFIYCLVGVPVFLEADNLLQIWLVDVPKYSSIVCRLFLVSIFFETIRYILIIDIHASGNVKRVSMFAGTLFCLVPFITYAVYYFGGRFEMAFVIILASNVVLCIVNLILVRHYIRISILPYVKAISTVLLISAASLVLAYFIRKYLVPDGYIHIVTNTIISILIVGCFYFTLCFDPYQRQYALKIIKNKLHLQ